MTGEYLLQVCACLNNLFCNIVLIIWLKSLAVIQVIRNTISSICMSFW